MYEQQKTADTRGIYTRRVQSGLLQRVVIGQQGEMTSARDSLHVQPVVVPMWRLRRSIHHAPQK